jgi:hypothetical protein
MSEAYSPKPKKLLDQLRDAIRIKHYSYSTEKTYVHWAKRYISIGISGSFSRCSKRIDA